MFTDSETGSAAIDRRAWKSFLRMPVLWVPGKAVFKDIFLVLSVSCDDV